MNNNKIRAKFDVDHCRFKFQRLSVDVLRKKAKSEMLQNEREMMIRRNDFKDEDTKRKAKLKEIRAREYSFITQLDSP